VVRLEDAEEGNHVGTPLRLFVCASQLKVAAEAVCAPLTDALQACRDDVVIDC
jgi:hypothetical protein